MKREYNIYAGLGGGFGGAKYQYTIKTDDEKEAEEYAYALAREEYESYEGSRGVLSWSDCAEELGYDLESDLTSDQEEEISEMYEGEIDTWIEYYYIPTEEDKETPESELERDPIFYESDQG